MKLGKIYLKLCLVVFERVFVLVFLFDFGFNLAMPRRTCLINETSDEEKYNCTTIMLDRRRKVQLNNVNMPMDTFESYNENLSLIWHASDNENIIQDSNCENMVTESYENDRQSDADIFCNIESLTELDSALEYKENDE